MQPLFSFSTAPNPGERWRWGQLPGDSLSLVIADLATQQNHPILVITPHHALNDHLKDTIAFFRPDLPILNFPDWETLPYDPFSPHRDIISERLQTLSQLPTLKQGILIISINTLLQKLTPLEFVLGTSFSLKKGDTLDLETMRQRLEKSGYRCVAQVIEAGEFAVRGSILDLFPMGNETPFRIDLFDDAIDSLRTFDPDTQRSEEIVESIYLLPAREFPLTPDAITRFREKWREIFPGNPLNCQTYQDVSNGFCPPGIEYYLPLFFEKTHLLLDYLPAQSVVCHIENTHDEAEHFWKEINKRYEQYRYDLTRPLLEPQVLYTPTPQLFEKLKDFSQIFLQKAAVEPGEGKKNFPFQTLPDLQIEYTAETPLWKLKNYLSTEKEKSRLLFSAESAGRQEVLKELLNKSQIIFTKENIVISPLEIGFSLSTEQTSLICIPESHLLGHRTPTQQRKKARTIEQDTVIRHLAELTIGSPVVHHQLGVGRYLGLQTLTLDNLENEFLLIEYAGGDKLYVPVASLHLISRYSGADPDHAPLNQLGTGEWEKAKRKAVEQIHDVAADLLEIHAKRAARKGFAFQAPNADYLAFAQTFPFEETIDQENAITQVLSDMQTPQSMDRLICGDVGFGKTEVAMRAAFLAIQNQKQVAILVPTTLLAEQHYQNFKDRFANWPINIEALSRFRSTTEQKKILERVKLGSVDLLIGTHRLIQKDVVFNRLGLLIIDEEHRFGVKQKEKLKSLRAEVDILTLTATPIPRTLNFALSGLRELSIIATPPSRRLAIKTFVHEHQESLIREAILRELLRGGQVYYLHNTVETIESCGEKLRALIPEARLLIAHGQMHERELERVMDDFYHRRFNVLVCTTIIETGIDIPTANTMIIERADKFGLAQLHQLRGRVGRSHHQAYAYLITPPRKNLTRDALKRLEAISTFENLGAGFILASHDLEIRGAGEILGESQSGQIQSIGFSLYMDLLERAVKALKKGDKNWLENTEKTQTEINLQLPALLPKDYIDDVSTRLVCYKRIASCENEMDLENLQVELIDRFGLLPEVTKNLFTITEIKLKAEKLGIKRLEANAQGGKLEFVEKPSINPKLILDLIQQQSKIYKLDGPTRLRFTHKQEKPEERLEFITNLLNQLMLSPLK